ncbi:MAG TPA: ABC transporter ATP-binding protein [Candidatus Saccharibacteria bacterium]|nr:ABC transporter ATP-binding protein [Candidatus Saccharibacteria bacterium]
MIQGDLQANTPLKMTNLTKLYGQYRGVKNINLTLQHGEVFGFLGPNGAGKSTTIRTILNFITPSEGSATIYGLDSVKDSVEIKNNIGYLAGDIALYDNMTGRNLLKFLTRLGKQTDWAYVDELARRLDANLVRPIHTLSKGNVQKIGLIQAFMHKPSLLILDEPTSGLDPLMKQVFYDMVAELKAQGKTIFVSSHDLTEVQKICDRAAFIRQGKLIAIEDIQTAKAINLRKYRARFAKKVDAKPFVHLANVSDVEVAGDELTLTVTGSIEAFITELAKHKPQDLNEQEVALEDLFIHYYKDESDNNA